MLAVGGAVLGNAAVAIEISVCAVGENLGETGVEVEGVGGGDAGGRLLEFTSL